jgi:hypothetical protein
MLNYLQRWIGRLRWQRLKPLDKLAAMLLEHLDGILNYCCTKVRMGVVEAVNGNIKSLLPAWAGIQESAVPAAEGSAHGRDPDGKWDFGESRLKCGARRIPAQSPTSSPSHRR